MSDDLDFYGPDFKIGTNKGCRFEHGSAVASDMLSAASGFDLAIRAIMKRTAMNLLERAARDSRVIVISGRDRWHLHYSEKCEDSDTAEALSNEICLLLCDDEIRSKFQVL